MTKSISLASLLLLSTAMVSPSYALAQPADVGSSPDVSTEGATPTEDVPGAQPGDQQAETEPAEAAPEISVPGASPSKDIVVRGQRNILRSTPEVINILSSQDIARSGDGNIAGSLQRVTGLSVVGSGFVYVRGLGDRYSLALLNGLPLPSPEPLKRVVPLDLFPTNLIDSSLVQKSFSTNFPGEFGGGVINLTTKAIPSNSFLEVGGSLGMNSETTFNLGYTYYGSDTDWLGFDDGTRDTPRPLQAAFDSGHPILEGAHFSRADLQNMAMSLVNAPTTLLQKNDEIPANWGATLTGGTSFDIGADGRLGIIATAGISNRWRTRDTLQQSSLDPDLVGDPQTSYQRVITDNRIVVNAMLGAGLELGDHKFRFTNLYVRDTVKQARLAVGTDQNQVGRDIMVQDTSWYERQLLNSQLVAEFEFDRLSLDLRGGYASSKREAPYERSFVYVRTNQPLDIDPVGDRFVNDLGGSKQGSASIIFSDLEEDLWAGGADASYQFSDSLTATVGYAYSDTHRTSVRRALIYRGANLPISVQQLRPDFLVSDATIQLWDISLLETSAQDGTAAFDASLKVHAGYGLVNLDLNDQLSINAGVRYETAKQNSIPVDLFGAGSDLISPTRLEEDYWLPGATLTYKPTSKLQFRLSGSKTIARPQFRELIAQIYPDPDANRLFRGNPSLVDSELLNAELRGEYYFGSQERLTAAAFYKKIDNPIETYTTITNETSASFANAPEASLYGAEVELQKFVPLESWGGVFDSRRLVVTGNYTYTKSELKVGAGDTTVVNGVVLAAKDFFSDKAPLTGQSDHLVNLQLGLEDTSRLSQQTLMLTYASKRVTQRGPSGQPDIYEYPGIQLDFVLREGFSVFGRDVELKLEARNLLGTKYKEYQENENNRFYYNRYDVGRTFSAGAKITF